MLCAWVSLTTFSYLKILTHAINESYKSYFYAALAVQQF
jgi:hypothetical protein